MMDPMDPSPSDPSTSMYILPAPQGKRLGRNASQKMSRRANEGVKRPRQQHGKEEKNDVQPAPLHLMAHPTLLVLSHGMLCYRHQSSRTDAQILNSLLPINLLMVSPTS